MEIRRCTACGHVLRPRSQVPLQGYCAAPACQRERRRRWQRVKRKSDSITTTIKRAHNARGKSAILTTGANTAANTRSTASATAYNNTNATSGGAIP
jgi:hypothetical protein